MKKFFLAGFAVGSILAHWRISKMARREVRIDGKHQEKFAQMLYNMAKNGRSWRLSLDEEDADAIEAMIAEEEAEEAEETPEEEEGEEPTEGFPPEPASTPTDGGTTPPTA